jgi:hypothetical protein
VQCNENQLTKLAYFNEVGYPIAMEIKKTRLLRAAALWGRISTLAIPYNLGGTIRL